MSKILVVVWNNFTHDKRVMNISQSLVKNSNQVDVVASKSKKGLKLCEQYDYRVYRIPLFSSLYSKLDNSVIEKQNKKASTSLKELIKNNKLRKIITAFLNWAGFNLGVLIKGLRINPDIIYANDLDTLTVSFLLAKLLKTKLIFDSHELWLFGNKFKNSTKLHQLLWIYLQKKLITKPDIVIVTTNYRKEFLKKQYTLENVHVIRNCPIYHAVDAHDLFRKEYGISSDRMIILYQGLLSKKRGIFTIVDVVKKIEDCTMIFMGMGEDKIKLKRYIEQKHLNHKVIVKDAVPPDKLLDYTSSADIGIQLLFNTDINHYSTISNKLLEYIMAGIAVIASDFPEIRKIVAESEIGFVVDPENKEQISEAIVKLVTDKVLLGSYKLNSRENRYKYTWEEEEKVLLKIFRGIS